MNCLLNDHMPSVRLDEGGYCNYCTASREARPRQDTADVEFSALLEKYGGKRYQVIMAYSGGKDSTYTLKLIKEKYRASILAVTFNNGFLSDACMANIEKVTDHLGIDSIVVKYPAPKLINAFRFIEDGKAFPKASLERASAICNLCIMLIKNLLYYEAIIRDIPIICFGWTPGQVKTEKPLIQLDYRMVSRVFDKTKSAIVNEFGSEFERYFLSDAFMKKYEDSMPYLYYPFVSHAYDEEKLLEEIRTIGWESPENTDGNSSNCLLNSYANQSHVVRFGYHPYAFEISNLIREGYMTREEGLKKIENIKNDSSYDSICEKFKNSNPNL